MPNGKMDSPANWTESDCATLIEDLGGKMKQGQAGQGP
jgi:hypothetical protein